MTDKHLSGKDYLKPLDGSFFFMLLIVALGAFVGYRAGFSNGQVSFCEDMGGLLTVEYGCIKDVYNGFINDSSNEIYELTFVDTPRMVSQYGEVNYSAYIH